MRTLCTTLLVVAVTAAPLRPQGTPLGDAQARAVLDTLRHSYVALDRIGRRMERRFADPAALRTRSTRTYGWWLAAGLATNVVARLDRDPGGYRDTWFTVDKWQHLNAGMLLTDGALIMRVPPRRAVLLTCLAATGYELTQGYVSRKDIAVGCGGSLLTVTVRRLQRRAER